MMMMMIVVVVLLLGADVALVAVGAYLLAAPSHCSIPQKMGVTMSKTPAWLRRHPSADVAKKLALLHRSHSKSDLPAARVHSFAPGTNRSVQRVGS